MAKKDDFQPIPLKPLTGLMDVRSNIDETPPGAFRFKLNAGINPDGKLSRALGWTRPFNITGICSYKNWDYHTQFDPAHREPVTLLFQSTTNDGFRRLLLGTKTKLGVMDEASGNWTNIGTGLGVDGDDSLTQLRFHAAELQNRVFFTNNFDTPKYYDFSGVVQEIPDLATAGEDGGAISKSRVIISWNGLIFLMNNEEDGARISSRIRWSDLNDGLAWDVSDVASVSEFQDLDYGEVILNAVPLGSFLYVFTDKSLWRCGLTINTDNPSEPYAVLNCIKVYTEPKNRAKCLAYPNSIVSTGFEIFYAASDGIYRFDPYLPQPERVEWIHRATGLIYKELGPIPDFFGIPWSTRIDKQACQSPIMEYVPGPNEEETAGCGELHVSWATYDPLAVPTGGETGTVDCDEIVPTPPPVGSGINRHTLVLNLKYQTADYRDYGSTAMVNFTSQLLSGGCAQQAMLIAANGSDLTLKQMDVGQYRLQYDPEDGSYANNGYYTKLRGVFPFENFPEEKIIESFLLGILPDDPNETAVISLRVGTSFEALDPNNVNGRCSVLWHQLSAKPIKCRNTRTATKYVADGVRPDDPIEWKFWFVGHFLYYELTLAKPDGTAPTSGGCQLSRFETRVKIA